MKIKVVFVFLVFLSLFSLCSFNCEISDNENKNLQNVAKIPSFCENLSPVSPPASLGKTREDKAEDEFFGAGGDELDKILESFESALPEGVPKSLDEISGIMGIEETFAKISAHLTSGENVKALALFIAIGILFALCELFSAELGDSASVARSVVAVLLSVPVLELMRGLVSEVSSGIAESGALFSEMIPVLTGILAIGSGGAAASLSAVTLNVSLGFVTNVLSGSLLPLSSMMFALSMVSAFDTGGITDGAVKGIRSVFNFLIGLSSLVIVGVLGVQTVVSVSADNLATKSAKYAISGMIPVVGGAVSGALSTLISGVKLLSATVGTVAVVALLSVVGLPLLRLLFFRFCLFLCITVSSFSGGSFGAKFFTSLRGALDTLIAVFVSSTLIYMLEIIIVTASIKGAL